MKRPKYIYMMITTDKYELPLAVARNVPELARLTGRSARGIFSEITRRMNGERKTAFIRVEEIADEDE